MEIRLFGAWIFCLCICVSCGLDERRGEGFPDRSGEFLGYVDGYLDTVSLFQRSRRYIQYVQDLAAEYLAGVSSRPDLC